MSEWISVEDRLPKYDKKTNGLGTPVLVYPVEYWSKTAAYYGNRLYGKRPCFYQGGGELYDITHWMYEPEPPNE